jgi:RNA ligase
MKTSPFPLIRSIEDVRPFVAGKQEISFSRKPNGITIGCYLFMDSHTFDSPQAVECRGVAFDADGRVVSRPLHKFFNLGERADMRREDLMAAYHAGEVAAVLEKIDGSMLATAWVDGRLEWRSKMSFQSDVVHLTQALLRNPEQLHLETFATEVAKRGWTAIFEFSSPAARIVVGYAAPQLRLLHVRDNLTGEYLLLNPTHAIHALIQEHRIDCVRRFHEPLDHLLDKLETDEGMEGYVIQFKNGDMVKVKCPWYIRYHRSVTFQRERDIALLALNENLDDVKQALSDLGIDLSKVEEIEQRLKDNLLAIHTSVEAMYLDGKDLPRKDFALQNQSKPYFSLAMQRYLGKDVPLRDYYLKNLLRTDFGLTSIADTVLSE